MATNGAGMLLSREADMDAFENLPREVRDLLNNSPVAVSAENVIAIKLRYDLHGNALLAKVQHLIAAHQESITQETYPEHPQLGELKYDKWPISVRYRRHVRRRA